MVANGSHQPREALTSAGAVEVTAPRVNDRRVDPDTGQRQRFPRRSCRPGAARPRRSTRCCRCCICTPVQRGPRARAGAELCRMAHRLGRPTRTAAIATTGGCSRLRTCSRSSAVPSVMLWSTTPASLRPQHRLPRRPLPDVTRARFPGQSCCWCSHRADRRQHDQREARSRTVRARMAASSARPGPSEVRSSASASTTP
jgi:hypothetical protein